MKKVVLIQRIIPHYRVKFFDLLSENCRKSGIDLIVIYGQESEGTVPKSVVYERPWSKKIQNKYINIFGIEFVWQPCLFDIIEADAVVIEQANRLSLTYIMAFFRLFGYRFALWGHGRNLQAGKNAFGLRERLKRKMLFSVNHFFAYTENCKKYLIDTGLDGDRITNVQNSIDVQLLIDAKEEFTLQSSLTKKQYTVVYCGGIYKDKKIKFLVDACVLIKSTLPEFKIIIIGEGPEDYLVKKFAAENTWVEYVGPKSGIDIVPYFVRSKLLLMPGLVGLAILDSFALATPMVTTDIPIHSPEFEYLSHLENGYVSKFDIKDYADAVVHLLTDDAAYHRLIVGCSKATEQYSVEAMASNFVSGLIKLLGDSSR